MPDFGSLSSLKPRRPTPTFTLDFPSLVKQHSEHLKYKTKFFPGRLSDRALIRLPEETDTVLLWLLHLPSTATGVRLPARPSPKKNPCPDEKRTRDAE